MSGYYNIESFPDGPGLGYLVRRSSTLLTELAQQAFAERGVPYTQWLTLLKLRDRPPQSVGNLATEIGHDQGAMTRVVDALVDAGFVERQRSREDRRRVEISLTAAGRAYVDAQLPFVVEGINRLIEVFSNEEFDQLLQLLQRLLSRLEALDEDRGSRASITPHKAPS
ncbi:MAG: MarR family winged helix-turn-helix transcriptional regulator [Sinobacteraceae bacterium]|nr:MarR family winged helix-turn-helix transcriptional regulator [Nevskiaceae bacterium]